MPTVGRRFLQSASHPALQPAPLLPQKGLKTSLWDSACPLGAAATDGCSSRSFSKEQLLRVEVLQERGCWLSLQEDAPSWWNTGPCRPPWCLCTLSRPPETWLLLGPVSFSLTARQLGLDWNSYGPLGSLSPPTPSGTWVLRPHTLPQSPPRPWAQHKKERKCKQNQQGSSHP